MHLLRGLLGVIVVLGLALALSRHRRAIRWRVIAAGLGLEVALAFLLLRSATGQGGVVWLTEFAERFLAFAYKGSEFVFGSLGQSGGPFHLAFQVLPIVIYFSAVTSALYRLGVLQVAVYAAGRTLGKLMGVSGAEAMSVVADVFVGMTEAPLVVRPYIARMTPSELFAMVTGGLATIAGTVLGAYMSFVGKGNASHLIAASFLAAPASLVIAKIIVPETGEPETGRSMQLRIEKPGVNLLDAIALGVRDGLALALNIGAMLIAFYALIALVNWPITTWAGFTIQEALGWVLSPFAWALGVEWKDATSIGSLLGTKIVLNEFIAYADLQGMIAKGVANPTQALSPHSVTIAIYALCGFANFGSIGVVLGGVGHLAPSRREDLARIAIPAMIAGALATCLTAAIAGAMVG